jgi:DNA invertase Pin-like site-specific DNA recombinase
LTKIIRSAYKSIHAKIQRLYRRKELGQVDENRLGQGQFETRSNDPDRNFGIYKAGRREEFMRVAIYARTSTSNGGQSPEMQLRELREHCQQRGWEISSVYVDAISGSKDSRPQLDRLWSDVRRRKVDVVLCWKLDRFSRSLKSLVNSLAELETLGVAFVSLRDNLDLATPTGRLMFQVIGAMAEFERSLIQERIRCGLRNARSKGRVLGRPKLDVNAENIRNLRASGLSWRKIALETGQARGTCQRAFSTPA